MRDQRPDYAGSGLTRDQVLKLAATQCVVSTIAAIALFAVALGHPTRFDCLGAVAFLLMALMGALSIRRVSRQP